MKLVSSCTSSPDYQMWKQSFLCRMFKCSCSQSVHCPTFLIGLNYVNERTTRRASCYTSPNLCHHSDQATTSIKLIVSTPENKSSCSSGGLFINTSQMERSCPIQTVSSMLPPRLCHCAAVWLVFCNRKFQKRREQRSSLCSNCTVNHNRKGTIQNIHK